MSIGNGLSTGVMRIMLQALAAGLLWASHSLAADGETGRTTLRLYAGAGMRPAVDDLAAAFAKTTGVNVEADYAGSGMLITRAREDRDADLFMPGDVWYVDQLHAKSGLVEAKTTIAYFIPVIIVPKGNPKKIGTVNDLLRGDIAVALGKPEACQVGRISNQILEKNGIDKSRIRNLKESLTVNELAVWVEMKDVDAAIVWDAIAAVASKGVDAIRIPDEKNVISEVVVGLLKTSRNKDAARQFVDFMRSEKGRAILRNRGYRVVLPGQGSE